MKELLKDYERIPIVKDPLPIVSSIEGKELKEKL
jgi:hypothetical protein